MSGFDITIEYIEEKENVIADTLSTGGTYKDSASASSFDISSPNHTPRLPPPVVVNYIFISHSHLLPPPTNTNHPNSMPPRGTISGMTGKRVYPPSSATRPYDRPQSSNTASSSNRTGLGDIFQQERDRRHQELQ